MIVIVFILIMLSIGAMFHFQPLIDKNDLGQTILTYRPHRRTKQRKEKVIKLW